MTVFSIKRESIIVPLVLFLTSFFVFTVGVYYIKFHVGLNDFWGILFYAENMRWTNKESLYNGFFPFGYAAILKLLPIGYAHGIASWLNIFLASLSVTAIALTARSLMGIVASVVALIICIVYPLVFEYSLIPGPDIGAAAFTSLAIALLWIRSEGSNSNERSFWSYVFAGFALGIAALWRSHCLVSAVAIIISISFLEGRQTLKDKIPLVLGFLALFSLQILVNLMSGHGVLETAQGFNIYKLIHGIDWENPPATIEGSVLGMILAYPKKFLNAYFGNLVPLLVLSVPALLSYFLSDNQRIRNFSAFAAIVIGLYSLPTALGGSERGPLVVIALFIVPLTFLILEIAMKLVHSKGRFSAGWVAISFVGLMVVGAFSLHWSGKNFRFMNKARSERTLYKEIESILVENGMSESKEVFTNTFDLYFPNTHPNIPTKNGGWARYSLWNFNTMYPEIEVGNVQAFINSCRTNNVRYLVIWSTSQSEGFLNDLYQNKELDSAGEVKFLDQVDGFKIYKL